MLTAAGSALVAGNAYPKDSQMNMLKVQVVRAFYYDGKVLPVSERPVELPEVFAKEMRAANKVVLLPASAAPRREVKQNAE